MGILYKISLVVYRYSLTRDNVQQSTIFVFCEIQINKRNAKEKYHTAWTFQISNENNQKQIQNIYTLAHTYT